MTPFERLTQLRAAYPPTMTPAQIGELLNAVAWEFRNDGMRLLGKKSGNNVPQPSTGTKISSDYLVHLPTLTGHDVLSGRPDGTTDVVRFTWGQGKENLGPAIHAGSRSIVDPVDPGTPVLGENGDTDPPPSGELDARVAMLEGQLATILERLGKKAESERVEAINKRFVDESEMLNVHQPLPDYEGTVRPFGRFGPELTVVSRPK